MDLTWTSIGMDGAVVAVGLVVIYTDWKYHKIYNVVTFPTILIGLGFRTWLEGGAGAWQSLAGLGAGVALTLVPFMLGFLWAGDVKYLAALGALKGPEFVVFAVLYGSLLHGLLALGVLLQRRELKKVGRNIAGYFGRTFLLRAPSHFESVSELKIPYGVGLALGSFLTVFFLHRYGVCFPLWA